MDDRTLIVSYAIDDRVYSRARGASRNRPELESKAVIEHTSDLARWQKFVCESFVPLTVQASPTSPFTARLAGRTCDGVFFSTIWASPHMVSRTPAHIAESASEYLKLTLLQSGSGLLRQDGREVLIHPGDIVLYDTSRPYVLEFTVDVSAIVVMFPHALLGMDRRGLSALTAIVLAKGSFARSVALFLRGLPSALDSLDAPTAARLTHNTVDLIQTMVRYELSSAASEDPNAELMLRIDDYINSHLDVHGLTPSMVAAANYISTRHLHELFHRRGLTVSRVVRERQLEHARRDLMDPMRRNESIGAIAKAWGFSDATRFSKSFREYVGMPPRAFRAAH